MSIVLYDVTSISDDRLPFVLDVYQQSFPPREQMQFSWWLNTLRTLASTEATGKLVAVIDTDREEDHGVVGMAYYETQQTEGVGKCLGYLWYLAIRSDLRGGGIGTGAYRAVVERILDTEGCAAMLFEVEQPTEIAMQGTPEEVKNAERRKKWYKRNGAVELGGVYYLQGVGWLPEFPMDVMINTREPITPEQAFNCAQELWSDSISQTGTLTFVP